MNDQMNTIFGWVLASCGLALGGSILAGMYFQPIEPDEESGPGYVIVAPEEDEGADAGPSLAELLASGSAEAGANVFARCAACHSIEQGGANGIGPNLYAVLGTNIGSHAPGFSYSSALSGKGGQWTYENMDAWLASPRGFADGTTMSFAGLGNPEDRANIILYMVENGGGPPLPEVAAAEPAADEAAEGEVPAEAEGAEGEAAEAAPAE